MPVASRDRHEIVTVVGNGVAGYACAARLAQQGRQVRMIGPGLPHDRPPLSKRALRSGRLPLFADADALTASGIVHLDGVVHAFDAKRRLLSVTPSSGGDDVVVEAPTLVWATGLRYPKPPLPGFEGTEQNSTGDGLLSLVRRLERPGQRVIVVGAGLIGTETAATLASDHRVTLVDMLERPLARFLPRISELARSMLMQLGVGFLGECRIEAATTGQDGWTLQTSTHGELRGDVVVSAAGFASSLPVELVGAGSRQLALDADETLRVIGPRPVMGLWRLRLASRIPDGAGSPSHTGITHSGAAATWPTRSWDRVPRTSGSRTSSATSGRFASSRSAWPSAPASGATANP